MLSESIEEEPEYPKLSKYDLEKQKKSEPTFWENCILEL
jgi:hypothetical protein